MAEIKVSTSQLRNVASQLSSLKSRLQSEASTMRSNQSSLTAQWDGPSNDVFDRTFKKNVTEFESFNTLIQDYINALNNYASEYESMERSNESIATTR